MPTPASPGTNEFRCEYCGRHLNSKGELRDHQVSCAEAYRSGRAGKEKEQPKAAGEENEDREWVSKP